MFNMCVYVCECVSPTPAFPVALGPHPTHRHTHIHINMHTLEHMTHPHMHTNRKWHVSAHICTQRYSIASFIFCTNSVFLHAQMLMVRGPVNTRHRGVVNTRNKQQAHSMCSFNTDFGEHGNIFLLHICSRNL